MGADALRSLSSQHEVVPPPQLPGDFLTQMRFFSHGVVTPMPDHQPMTTILILNAISSAVAGLALIGLRARSLARQTTESRVAVARVRRSST